MSDHNFEVTVRVEDWLEGDSRDPAEYAAAALRCASLPDASRLDGYADLAATAYIVPHFVDPLP